MTRRIAPCLLVIGACLALTSYARADVTSCVAAHTEGQRDRQAGRLRAAETQLQRCAASSCPEAIRDDCVRWVTEVASMMPSVVVSVRNREGHPVTDGVLSVDGERRPEFLSGRALFVDPGVRVFRFARGDERVELNVTVFEGRKAQPVSLVLGAPTTPIPSSSGSGLGPSPFPSPSPSRPERASSLVVPAVLAGVSLASFASFAIFGALGRGEEVSLRDRCAPYCTEAEQQSVRTKYVLADVSLGVGFLSLGLAAYFFFSRPSSPPPQPPAGLSLHFGVASGSGGLDLRGRF